ncbi:MAG: Hsp20/alpha crystallin family protein [Sulfuricurvum sp.]
MKKMFSKVFSLAAGLIFTAASLLAAPQPETQKCNPDCPFWDMEQMENFFNRPFPKMNGYLSSMKESDKAYLITIDLPGMDKKDINIETSGNRLSVSGERKEESESKEVSKHSYAQFHQSYLLPDDADLGAITASSLNGVLKITVPKNGTKKAIKKVEIK